MKKAGNILIIIGIILCAISGALLVATGIIFLVYANPQFRHEIVKMLQDGSMTTSFTGSLEEQAAQIQQLFQVFGIIFFIIAAGYAIDIVIASLTARGRSKGLYITTLVFNVIFFNLILIIGSVFGLTSDSNER